MPKIKVRPSAAQARLLIALNENEDLLIYMAEPRYVTWYGGGKYDWEWNRIYGKIRMPTARAMIREEWLECVDLTGDWNQQHTYGMSEEGRQLAETLRPDDAVPKHKGISVYDIHRVLRKRYPPPEWVYLEEVRLGTGYTGFFLKGYGKAVKAEQRIDGLALNCYESKRWKRISFEIKISRADFLKEVKDPDKRMAAQMVSNQFFFVVPEGLVKLDEVPDECGLLEVRGDFVKLSAQAEWQEAAEWHPAMVASLLRSAASQR